MKTILIADENGRERHVGEDFDDFLEVVSVPTTDILDEWADLIRQRIRRQWSEDNSTDRGVLVVLDAPSIWTVVFDHLQVSMLRDEKITFNLAGQ